MSTQFRLFLRTLRMAILLSLLMWGIISIEHLWRAGNMMLDTKPTPPYISVSTTLSNIHDHTSESQLQRIGFQIIQFWRYGN